MLEVVLCSIQILLAAHFLHDIFQKNAPTHSGDVQLVPRQVHFESEGTLEGLVPRGGVLGGWQSALLWKNLQRASSNRKQTPRNSLYPDMLSIQDSDGGVGLEEQHFVVVL